MNERPPAMPPLPRWLSQVSVWRCVEHLAAGRLPPSPLSIELHLGTACNLACPECISRPILGTQRFDPDRCLSLAKEIVDLGVGSVILSGGGEPLLHPSASAVIQTLAEGGVPVALVTNGTLLHHHMDTVARWAERVWVSVDAATASTHRQFRPHRSGEPVFEQLIDNLRNLAMLRRGRVTFCFLLLARGGPSGVISNASEIVSAAKIARDLGCGTFEVNVAFDRSLRIDPFLESQSGIVADQLGKLISMGTGGFHVYVSPMVEGVAAGQVRQSWPPRAYKRCLAAEIRALVGPRGIYLCPRHQDLATARYGDPKTTPLKTLWGSVPHQEALQRVIPCKDCSGPCMSMELNDKMNEVVALLRGGTAPPTLVSDEDLFI